MNKNRAKFLSRVVAEKEVFTSAYRYVVMGDAIYRKNRVEREQDQSWEFVSYI